MAENKISAPRIVAVLRSVMNQLRCRRIHSRSAESRVFFGVDASHESILTTAYTIGGFIHMLLCSRSWPWLSTC
jgi:hypothetical protein